MKIHDPAPRIIGSAIVLSMLTTVLGYLLDWPSRLSYGVTFIILGFGILLWSLIFMTDKDAVVFFVVGILVLILGFQFITVSIKTSNENRRVPEYPAVYASLVPSPHDCDKTEDDTCEEYQLSSGGHVAVVILSILAYILVVQTINPLIREQWSKNIDETKID